MLLLAAGRSLPFGGRTEMVVRVLVLAAVIWVCSRRVVTLDAPRWAGSVALGVGVFLAWILPDLLLPGYRSHWLLSNWITGDPTSSYPPELRSDPVALGFRTLRAVVIVPIAEELFWRGWLPRWFERMDDFRRVPLGQYTPTVFWLTAVLFATEHGAFWDVGLVAGIAYNWWMRRTASLGDLILCHAVTNACLAGYVIAGGRWEYW